jgi:hypothetical protein
MKIAIVVPCISRPSDAWIEALETEAKANKAKVVIVDDSNGKLGTLPARWEVLDYKRQENFLGDLYPEFARLFHKCSACRVVGHLWAYKRGNDVVIGLDNDCIVPTHFIRDHIQFLGKDWGAGWFNPIGRADVYSRGFPYSARNWKIVANMGLWKNVLDINGKDRKEGEMTEVPLAGSTVPTGYFPFSGMNFALAREAIFRYLFIPNFDYIDDKGTSKFRRIDDIWGGYIFQKFLQKNHQSTMVGYPIVYHDTIVDPKEDEENEVAMCNYEDSFIEMIDSVFNSVQSRLGQPDRMFLEIYIACDANPVFKEIAPAFLWWQKVIEEYADI